MNFFILIIILVHYDIFVKFETSIILIVEMGILKVDVDCDFNGIFVQVGLVVMGMYIARTMGLKRRR